MAFTPAAPFAIVTGNVCAVSLIGYGLGKYWNYERIIWRKVYPH
jgi:hypothetical protein